MDADDIIFSSSLFFSIGFGFYYRTIRDQNVKKNIGTIIGILLMLIIAKTHIFHLLVTTLVNASIILYTDTRRCHLVSLAFSFPYLVYLSLDASFGATDGSFARHVAQMMLTLKLVGLAFEVNTTYTTRNKSVERSEEEEDEDDANCVEPTLLDVFHYAFNYIGIVSGPYYRYRTFIDYFQYPFAEYADWKLGLLNTLKFIPFYTIIFLWVSHNWPLSYTLSEEFFERSWFYRYCYIWPTFLWFRMRMYIGFSLSNSVHIAAGLGAYPSFTKPRSGQGPSQNFSEMKKILLHDNLSDVDFDFKTVQNIDAYKVEFCTTYKETIRGWNMVVQYWLAANIYKRFPLRKYRAFATFLVSSLWHGASLGFYVCLAASPLVLHLEDIYHKLHLVDRTGKVVKVYQWVHWFFKMHFFSYQMIAVELRSVELILRYYNSVYHMGVVVGVILYAVAWFLLKMKEDKT